MKFAYDQSYFPTAPHIEIWIGVPEESLSVGPLSAFVDSGADATIIPISYIRPLKLEVADRKRIRSPWGDAHIVDIYFVDLGIGDVNLPPIEVVADENSEEIIVGRNVLNRLRVVLDGIKQVVEVYPS